MGNLKTMFTNKFLESDLPVVFHNARWIKIIEAVCAMKMEYPGKNNINLVNPNQQAGKLLYLFGLSIHSFILIIVRTVLFFLCFSCFNYNSMFLKILNILCNYYASYDSHINILNFVPFWNQTFTDR